MKLKSILKEIAASTLRSITLEELAQSIAEAWYTRWERERERLGDEYPETHELEYLFGKFDYGHTPYNSGYYGFLYDCVENNRITNELASGQEDFDSGPGARDPEVKFQGEKCASFPGGCYYNALDFMLRTDRNDVELAYGLMVDDKFTEMLEDPSDTSGLDAGALTEHSFILIDGKKVFDPSLPHSELRSLGTTYVYKTVPESVYKKFPHDFDDENYTAREFGKLIDEQLREYKGKIKLKERLKKLYEKRG